MILCERPDEEARPCHRYLGQIQELRAELAEKDVEIERLQKELQQRQGPKTMWWNE